MKLHEADLLPLGELSPCVPVQLVYEALPKDTVQFGHAIRNLSQDEDGVTLQFADQPDARADYVVAADGYALPSSTHQS